MTLIPRNVLFGNPARTNYQIGPDGLTLTWVAPVDGVLNVFCAPRDRPDEARQMTFDTGRGVSAYAWTYRPHTILYAQDHDGDENTRLTALDLQTGATQTLVDMPGVKAMLGGISRRIRDEVVVQINDRDPHHHDLYRIALATGERTMIARNEGLAGFIVDEAFTPVAALARTSEGGSLFLKRIGDPVQAPGQAWTPFLTVQPDDTPTTLIHALSSDGRRLFFTDSRGHDTAALRVVDLESGTYETLAHDETADIAGLTLSGDGRDVIAYHLETLRHEIRILDPRADDITWLGRTLCDPFILDRTEDDAIWIVGDHDATRPAEVMIFDRTARRLTPLPPQQPELQQYALQPMQCHVITARDGLALPSYLTLPASPTDTMPLVLLVHGGPEDRDHYGYDPLHQWLADRGYAALSVNFRGSRGFGKAHQNAGRGEWGRAMDDDLNDARAWACRELPIDPKRIAIFGGSYGGYAVLAAMTRQPEAYACGIDIVGPSNLESLIATIPPYWETERGHLARMIGDPQTDAGRALLRERSPLHRADQIRRPLLVAQGANDPRVARAESDQMVAALRAHEIPVSYLVFEDEGHGFARPENSITFFAEAEAFLARHLGGRCEAADPTVEARSSLVRA